MKKILVVFLSCLVSSAFAQSDKALVRSHNDFTFNTFRYLQSDKDHVLFSPMDLEISLGLLYPMINEEESAQLNKLVPVLKNKGLLKQNVDNLLVDYKNKSGLNFSGWIYGLKKEDALLPEDNILQAAYSYGRVADRDFLAWSAKKNEHKVELKDSLHSSKFVLASVINFYNRWQSEFDDKLTTIAPYHVDKDNTIDLNFITRPGDYKYFANDEFQSIEVPLSSESMSIMIILPKSGKGFHLTSKDYERAIKEGEMQKLDFSMPSFSFESRVSFYKDMPELKNSLTTLTLNETPHSISQIQQVSHVNLTEKGFEWTTETVLKDGRTYDETGSRKDKNHPFVFLLKDNESSAVIFIGSFLRF